MGEGARGPARRERTRSRRRLAAWLAAVLVGATLGVPATASPGAANTLYVPWSIYLPGWTDSYVPTSENDCVAGRSTCLRQTLKELNRIFELNGKSCHHNAIFSLAYLRITQTYGWSRNIPGYYEDVRFANHQDAVFARYYTDHYYNWRNGRRAKVPKAWLMAFDAARDKELTGAGDLMMGMNAHINRDLPFVVANVGLVAPDGSSRKRDYDMVEDFLARAAGPLMAEMTARFDPRMGDANDPLGVLNGTVMQVISLWRENAWRNAERLVSARTPEARQRVAASIESQAQSIGRTIRMGFKASSLLGGGSTARTKYCKANHTAKAPQPYPFGTPRPYGL